jgi:hypothetical protein
MILMAGTFAILEEEVRTRTSLIVATELQLIIAIQIKKHFL